MRSIVLPHYKGIEEAWTTEGLESDSLPAGPVILPEWIWAILIGVFALACWILAVHLVNLYRFVDQWVDGRDGTEA